ncbi:unnamed protein product [Arabidopsis halleri]
MESPKVMRFSLRKRKRKRNRRESLGIVLESRFPK